MRHEASGAVLTLGWLVLAVYLVAVLIAGLVVGSVRAAAAAVSRGRRAASRSILGAAWMTLRRGQEVDHA